MSIHGQVRLARDNGDAFEVGNAVDQDETDARANPEKATECHQRCDMSVGGELDFCIQVMSCGEKIDAGQ